MSKQEAIKAIEQAIASAELSKEDMQQFVNGMNKTKVEHKEVEAKDINDLNISLIKEFATSKMYHEKDSDFYFFMFNEIPSYKKRTFLKKKSLQWNPDYKFWYHRKAREMKAERIGEELESVILN